MNSVKRSIGILKINICQYGRRIKKILRNPKIT
jgi:hypothetical protein